jgi:AIPR protein
MQWLAKRRMTNSRIESRAMEYGDGQIDAMYVLANGATLSGEDDKEIPEKGPIEIDIIIIQSKNKDSFEENPLKIIRTTALDLIDLKRDYSTYLPNYSEKLQDRFALARKALLASAGRTAKVRVRVYYATKGGTDNIHPNVICTGDVLKKELSTLVATRDVDVEYLGAEKLIARSRLPKTRIRYLEVQQSLSSDIGDSFACLVTLEALVSFLSDDKGDLIRALFDANVRDFLGKTEVNDAIRDTLQNLADDDFWWFNNGITIVATGIDQKGKKLALEEALLVNGLQTSNVIFSFMTDPNVSDDIKVQRRSKIVLMKLIVPPNEKIRDDIIKATNSQTHIPKPYLRGMDLVHRNIEDHLKSVGIFYERRKNQYRNLGKKRSTIVTLSEVAQALMAALLFRSADARGRPNSLLKSDEDYQSLFSNTYHLDTFKNVILAKRAIIVRCRKISCRERGVSKQRCLPILAYISAKQYHTTSHAVLGWKTMVIKPSELDVDVEFVVKMFKAAGGTNQIAKSASFQDKVTKSAKQRGKPLKASLIRNELSTAFRKLKPM